MADDLGDDCWQPQENPTDEINDAPKEHVSKRKQLEADDVHTTTNDHVKKAKVKKKKWKKMKITELLAQKPPEPLQAKELISAIEAQFKESLSPIELDQIMLADSHFVACNDVGHNVSTYLKMVCPKWRKLMTDGVSKMACPFVIVVTGAASRAVHLIRELADFKMENCKVGKLFAKHMKLGEQVKFLKSSPVHIAVGTPNRLNALLENDSLKLDGTKVVILDWSWRDLKQRRLIDIADIQKDLWMLLVKYCIPRLKKQHMKVALL